MSANAFRSIVTRRLLPVLCAASCLAACTKGELDLAIADAPVDDARAVVIEFAGIEVQPVEGKSETITFNSPIAVNLLDYAGGASAKLLTGELLDVGEYSSLRLIVNAEEDVRDSYIITANDEEFDLTIPSDALAGLTINHTFKISNARTGSFTIDFDLRKSVLEPLNDEVEYRLRPALRWVDNDKQGTLSGTVDQSLIASECGIGDKAAVYVYSSNVNVPNDVDDDANTPEPITTARVPQDGVSAYTAAFLEAGDYKVAFTCDAANDQADTDDADIEFTDLVQVTINAGLTTTHDF